MTDNEILFRQAEITLFRDITIRVCLAHNLPLNMEVLSIVIQISYMFAELSTIPSIGYIKGAFVICKSCLAFCRGQTYIDFPFPLEVIRAWYATFWDLQVDINRNKIKARKILKS